VHELWESIALAGQVYKTPLSCLEQQEITEEDIVDIDTEGLDYIREKAAFPLPGNPYILLWDQPKGDEQEGGLLYQPDMWKQVFVYNPYIYLPLFLEIKRIMAEKELGSFHSGELVFFYDSDRDLLQLLECFTWLLGKADAHRFFARNKGSCYGVFQFGEPAAVSLTIIRRDSKQFPTSKGRGELFFQQGVLQYTMREEGTIIVRTTSKEPYSIVLPEGSGDYYFVLDAWESINEVRGSFINSGPDAVENKKTACELLHSLSSVI
jgi:hypothetical protein